MNEAEYIYQQVQAWCAKGDNDLKAAEIVIKVEDPPTDTVCFHCQQAAEKYLKGFLVKHNISFPKTHNLHYLLGLCQQVNEQFQQIEDEISILSEYSIEVRYPTEPPIVYSQAEAQTALTKAKIIVNFVKNNL